MKVRVKICGITRPRDAVDAVEAGADALGFMFYRASKRFISTREAKKIIEKLPPFVARVGVFVNASKTAIEQAIETAGLDTIQLHGDETPEFCAQFKVKVIKAFSVTGEAILSQLPDYNCVQAWMLDSSVPGKRGGTGTTADWSIVRRAVRLKRPVILAGGLTPANVVRAIRVVRPYAVDVSSGVESKPGIKDRRKIRAFIKALGEGVNA